MGRTVLGSKARSAHILTVARKSHGAIKGSRRDQKIKRSRGGRWSWTFKLAQKRSRAGRWSWAAKVALLSLRVVPQQQCNGHCLCDCPARQLKQQLRGALVAAQWRGDTALTTSIVLAAVHGLSGLFRAVSAVEPSLFSPPPVPVPNKPPRFCGRKAKWSRTKNVT